MKKITKIVSLMLVLVMVLGLFTGCGKKTSEEGGNKLKVGIPQEMSVLDYDTNSFTVWLEEETGIDIEWVYYANSSADYVQQLATSAGANEEFPDVMLGFVGLSHYQVNQYGEDGYFIDLSDLIEEHAPNYKKALENLDKEKREYILEKAVNTKDGKSIYAMPSLEMEYADNLQSLVYINTEWLNKLGLQKPTTVAEFEAVCEAFANGDPNGNGKADEFALVGAEFVPWLLNAYIEYDSDSFNIDASGTVWDPLYTDEFRQGMTWIKSLVDKGYYNKLNFTMTTSEAKALVSETNGISRVGMYVGHHESMTLPGYDGVMDKYVALEPLQDATGKGGYTIVNATEPRWGAYITQDCENPELAMKLIDIFYTDEAITRQRWGEKDLDWEYKEGTTVQGTPSYVHPLNQTAFQDKSQNTTLGNILYIMSDWNYLSIVDESVTTGRNYHANRLQGEQWTIMQNAKERTGVENLVYTTEEYEVREEKLSAVNTYVAEQLKVFASGVKDVTDDAAWEEFHTNLEKTGRKDLMKVAQDAMDRKAK